MGKLTFDISMSLDGFIAGPDMSEEEPLGVGGERLHEWGTKLDSWRESHGRSGGERNESSTVIEEQADAGAAIMGRRMFGPVTGPWGDDPWEGWWGDEPPFHHPVFVLTHHEREPLVKGETTFHFVTDGIESALEQASGAAGDADVSIGGGANVIQQYLKAGLVDEMRLHVVPIFLGTGVRLFEDVGDPRLERTRVIEGPDATHLRYRVA